MEFIYTNEKYIVDQNLLEELLWDLEYQYTRGKDLTMNRYDIICDIPEFIKFIIEQLQLRIPNIKIFDVSHCIDKSDYLKKKETLLKEGPIISIKHGSLIQKFEGETPEKDLNFYNKILNFLRDYYRSEDIKYQEIMFFNNDEYRTYIKYAYDISSMSNFVSANKLLIKENDLRTLDDILEEKYLKPDKLTK